MTWAIIALIAAVCTGVAGFINIAAGDYSEAIAWFLFSICQSGNAHREYVRASSHEVLPWKP